MNDMYSNRLTNRRMHSAGMQMKNAASFLPKEAFLTECKHTEIFAITPSIKTNITYNHTALHPVRDASLGRKKSKLHIYLHPVRDASFGRKASIIPTLHSVRNASLCKIS